MMAATRMSVPSDEPDLSLLRPDPSVWIESHQTWLWRYLRYLSATPDVAEDICQDTLIAALQHRIPEREREPAMAWLLSLIHI